MVWTVPETKKVQNINKQHILRRADHQLQCTTGIHLGSISVQCLCLNNIRSDTIDTGAKWLSRLPLN